MPTSVIVAIAILSLCLPLVGWALLAGSNPAHQRMLTNLQRGLEGTRSEESPSDAHRRSALVVMARRLTPRRSMLFLDRLLSRAGRPAAWPL